MVLATQCPHCHTTFRVVQDQLKLRAGLVRCGACKEIFNGIEHLLRPDEPVHAPATPTEPREYPFSEDAVNPAISETPPAAEDESVSALHEVPDAEPNASEEKTEPAAADDFIDFFEFLKPAKVSAPPLSDKFDNESKLPAEPDDSDPLQRMTLMDFTHDESDTDDGTGQSPSEDVSSDDGIAQIEAGNEEDPDASDPIAQTIDALQRKPPRRPRNALQLEDAAAPDIDEPELSESEEPSFVRRGRRKQQLDRIMRILMAVASVLLLIGLIAQGAYVLRDQIAVRLPQTKSMLAKACLAIGCRLDLPTQIDAVSIESNELQTLAADKQMFALATLLRNHSATTQAWPNIELTLNDVNEKAIARRVFTPREYLLSTQDLTKGFAPASEQPVKLFFELHQLKPSGYRVYLFYP